MPSRPLTIGVDARAAVEVPAGRGRVVRELLAALARRDGPHRYVLYCRDEARIPGVDERFTWERMRLRDPAWHLRAALAATRSCDAFLSTNSYLTAWFLGIPSAVIVHDLIAFVPGAAAQRRAQRIERATLRPALRCASAVICNSRATREDLVARFPRVASKATVVQFAADARFGRPFSAGELAAVRALHDLPDSFVLSVGTLEPRKNLERLMSAYAGLPDQLRRAHPLVVAGPQGWEMADLLARFSAQDDVRLLGFVEDEDLAALYQLCTVFAYPSLYEGFGLPVLEAMQSGAPTITSGVSSLPEVGGDAAVYVDPRSVDEIRAALRELLESPGRRAELGQRGVRRARDFSWDRAAAETLAVLEGIA